MGNEFELEKNKSPCPEAVESISGYTENLLVEAGNRVGKSLAYLLPATVFSLENGVPVVISTETIALQNQLIAKMSHWFQNSRKKVIAEVALGANNYVCKRKLGNVISVELSRLK